MVLLVRAPLSERTTTDRFALRLEDRVVAEAITATWRRRDPAAAGPALEPQRFAGDRQGEHAHVARPATLRRQPLERREQLRVVVRVGRILAGVPPRPD